MQHPQAISVLLARALEQGWSIIPTGPDKKPLIKTWKPYQSERPTPKEISEWSKLKPAGWAVVTGALSRIIVLDFDGEAGARTIRELRLQPHRRTGSGGFHVDFIHPGWPVATLNHKSKASLGQHWPGLDIRADGGYAVFAGRNKKGEYVWLRNGAPPDPLDILPADLRDFLGLLRAPTTKANSNRVGNQRTSDHVELDLLINRALGMAQTEGRNNAGFWLATQIRDNGYSGSEANEALGRYVDFVHGTNVKGSSEPYTKAEAMASVRQAYSRSARAPWGQQVQPPSQEEDKPASSGLVRAEKKSQATRLVDLALANGIQCFHTPEGKPYATLETDGHLETYLLKSKALRQWLAHLLYVAEGTAPGAQAGQSAIAVLEGKALFEGPEYPVFTRIAEFNGAIYLDLANDHWQAVEITSQQWRILSAPPVRFRRARGMLPLPNPETGGSVKELRSFLNLETEADWVLALAWLIGALRGSGPYPILALHGEQGSAKSTAAKVFRALIDPNSAPLRSEPRDEHDLVIAASNGHVIALDNLSRLPDWLSDALCRLSTGGGFGTRELYTDEDEVIFDAVRPIVVNGIEEIISRGDLLDRAQILYLPAIRENRREPESDFWQRFNQARPMIFAAVLNAVSTALRNLPNTKLAELPRMADYAIWVTAAEPALELKGGTFISEYTGNRDNANALVLEASTVAQAVQALSEERGFQGTATELLALLNKRAEESIQRQKSWPKNGRSLSGKLRRLAPNLRATGIGVYFDRISKRSIEIEKIVNRD